MSKKKTSIASGICHIYSTYNNIIVTFTDPYGNVICSSSGGKQGFKGSRKATPFAAQTTGESAAKKAVERGMKTVEVHVRGPGAGKESAIQAIRAMNIIITMIMDITSVMHNGVRPPKKRRV